MLRLKEPDLLQACSVLLGAGIPLDLLLLENLRLSDLILTFRRHSLETHPDGFLHRGPLHLEPCRELFQQSDFFAHGRPIKEAAKWISAKAVTSYAFTISCELIDELQIAQAS